jgi:GNAT superfamily N-acetyltransferase
MGNLKIKQLTNQDDEFYNTLGPYLSRRDIVAEIGAPIWDDDGKEWFVARVGRKVAGFAALKTVGKHRSLVSAYVLPDFRRRGIYRELVVARLAHVDNGPLKAVATEASVPTLKWAGLKATGARGKFTVMER